MNAAEVFHPSSTRGTAPDTLNSDTVAPAAKPATFAEYLHQKRGDPARDESAISAEIRIAYAGPFKQWSADKLRNLTNKIMNDYGVKMTDLLPKLAEINANVEAAAQSEQTALQYLDDVTRIC